MIRLRKPGHLQHPRIPPPHRPISFTCSATSHAFRRFGLMLAAGVAQPDPCNTRSRGVVELTARARRAKGGSERVSVEAPRRKWSNTCRRALHAFGAFDRKSSEKDGVSPGIGQIVPPEQRQVGKQTLAPVWKCCPRQVEYTQQSPDEKRRTLGAIPIRVELPAPVFAPIRRRGQCNLPPRLRIRPACSRS
jgi:hypothetical protein